MMKVLLVRPPITLTVARRLQSFLHLEPLALACEKSVDGAYLRSLAEFKPDVIGFTSYSNEAATVKRLAAVAKERRAGSLIMVGGTHATTAPDDLRLPGVIDLVIRGEGGTAMRELIPRLERKVSLPESDVFLPVNSPRFAALAATLPPELPPYDQVPAARRDLVDRSRYYCIWHGKPGERLPTLFPRTGAARTSVGRPFRCSFGVVNYLAGGKYVGRPPGA